MTADLTIVIKGTAGADTNGRLTPADISKTIEFCSEAHRHVRPEESDALIAKIKNYGFNSQAGSDITQQVINETEKTLTLEELQALNVLQNRRMVREDAYNLDIFTFGYVDGLSPNMAVGKLDLKRA